MESGGEPDIGKLIRMSSAPEQSHNDYKAWLKVLVDHYRDLLRSGGNDLESMIRAVYKTRSNYLLYINHLNRVESQFNAALKPSLKKTTDGVNDVISRIEQRCISLRREEAQTIFP